MGDTCRPQGYSGQVGGRLSANSSPPAPSKYLQFPTDLGERLPVPSCRGLSRWLICTRGGDKGYKFQLCQLNRSYLSFQTWKPVQGRPVGNFRILGRGQPTIKGCPQSIYWWISIWALSGMHQLRWSTLISEISSPLIGKTIPIETLKINTAIENLRCLGL